MKNLWKQVDRLEFLPRLIDILEEMFHSMVPRFLILLLIMQF